MQTQQQKANHNKPNKTNQKWQHTKQGNKGKQNKQQTTTNTTIEKCNTKKEQHNKPPQTKSL